MKRLFLLSIPAFFLCMTLVEANASIIILDVDIFNPTDATTSIQNAFDSDADTILIKDVGYPWIVSPLFIKRDNLTLILEPGVVIQAKSGAFPGLNDNLLELTKGVDSRVKNIKIIGYGATLKMLKNEYKEGQWRHCLHLHWVENVEVFGLRCESSGGDGFFVDRNHFGDPSINVHLKDCVAHNNKRQGVFVISVDGLLIENCAFRYTSGEWPMAGIDIEPDMAGEVLKNILVRNCRFVGNAHSGIEIALHALDSLDEPVSIRFENCYVKSNRGINLVSQPGIKGFIEFDFCYIEDSDEYGLEASLPAYNYYTPPGKENPEHVLVRFNQCIWRNVGNYDLPFLFRSDAFGMAIFPNYEYGGIEFVDCVLQDNRQKPFLKAIDSESALGIANVRGNLSIVNPNTPSMDLGSNPHDMDDLLIRYEASAPPTALDLYSDNQSAVEENLDYALITARRTAEDLSMPLALKYYATGEAVRALDYTLLPEMLIIPVNQTSAQDTLFPLPDTETEGVETLDIALAPSSLYAKGP